MPEHSQTAQRKALTNLLLTRFEQGKEVARFSSSSHLPDIALQLCSLIDNLCQI
jgi:hypothetical protein